MPRISVPVLAVTGLGVQRGGTMLLDGVSWTVSRGEHWVVLGPNGSGKTSLLSALTGYLTPTSGEVRLLGEEYGASDWRELRKRIGLVSSAVRQMVPDAEPAGVTVASGRWAVIGHWGKASSVDMAASAKLLRQVEGMHLWERAWGVLSQGERQRVLIARALMTKPEVLILDEPCAGLDPVAREGFLGFVDRLGRRRGSPALILVTHHIEEIMPVFTHALLLRAGKVAAAGPVVDVLTSLNLTKAFGVPCDLTVAGDRYVLQVHVNGRGLMR